jgi:F0F1-type ATP synthase alpha subunit
MNDLPDSLKIVKGGGSLTALPIIEKAGDVSAIFQQM